MGGGGGGGGGKRGVFSVGMGTKQGHVVDMEDSFLVLMCLGLNGDAGAGAG